MKKTVFWSFLIITVVPVLCRAVENSSRVQFNEAKSLQKKGREEEAFRRYLTLPGAEDAAVALARSTPQKYLEILETPGKDTLAPIVALIEGDLALATGDRNKALSCYRTVTASIATTEQEDWDTGHIPLDYYPVDPSSENRFKTQLLQPFMVGPGSHRDNWLIRRFIALDAMDDAAQEFDRIWNLYRKMVEPYVLYLPVFNRLESSINPTNHVAKAHLVTPVGYNGCALQFALDYAYFLKRNGNEEKSNAVLWMPLLAMDMDIDPNHRSYRKETPISEEEAKKYPSRKSSNLYFGFGGWGYSSGISRKEFIRLVYGEFKQAGKEQDLVDVLQKNIVEGKTRSRRVLARLRLHQGRIDDAIALELDYIENGGFDPFSAIYRRGLVYEELQRPKEAALEYEKLLTLTTRSPADLPDPDEVSRMGSRQNSVRIGFDDGSFLPKESRWLLKYKTDIANRLQRIYAAQGETDKLLSLSLVQFDLNPGLLEEFDVVQKTAARFKMTGHGNEFKKWVADRATASENPSACANLYWALGDPVKTAEALKACRSTHLLPSWKSRFRKEGKETFRILLDTLLSVDPSDSQSRLELLDLAESPLGKDAIPLLERLLAADAKPAFPRGKGSYNRTRFRNYYDLAYRLMRLYERENQTDRLQSLGLRMALNEKPFTTLNDIGHGSPSYNRDERHRTINSCLSLLLHHADDATLEQIAAAWKDLPDFPAKRQLERRRNGDFKCNESEKPFAWVNVPEGIKPFASNENVLSLAQDDHHVYAGHPWGVAVYDHAGNPVVRIALGTAALHLEICNNMLWVGTPIGLTRIEPETWAVAYLAMNQDIPANKRDVERKAFENGVCSLACDGNSLWIGTRRNIQCLDTKNRSLRIFSKEELHVQGHNDWNYFILESNSVWVNGYHGVHRYDRKAKTWAKVQYHDTDVHLIGLVEGKLFGHVLLPEPLRNRPCLIDRNTLEVTPILIAENLAKDQRCINGPFCYFGSYHGKPVFGPKRPSFIFDEASCKLKPIGTPWDRKGDPIESNIPSGLRGGSVCRNASGIWVCDDDLSHRHTVLGKPFFAKHWNLLTLPNGTMVLGGEHSGSPRYIYPSEDWPFSLMPKNRPSHSGGLHFISTNQQIRCISSRPYANVILGDTVFSIVDNPKKKCLWLCTDSGLSILDSNHAILANIQQADGLCANRITSGATIGNQIYFSSAWGDHSGGLITYDPETSLFTTRYQSDGLATDKLASIENDGGKIKLIYATEYLRRSNDGFRYRLYPPGSFNPKTKAVTSSSSPKLTNQNEKRSPAKRKPMPYLGGFILSEQTLEGNTYTCGTRGMIVSKRRRLSPPPPVRLNVDVVMAENLRLIQEATALKIQRPISMEKLRKLLQHDNPYVRANALAAIPYGKAALRSKDFIPLLATCMTNPCLRVRTTALYALSRSNENEKIIPILENALLDTDPYIRAVATLHLCKRGIIPDIKYIQEIFENGHHYGNFPYGATSTIGVVVCNRFFCAVIAPHATPEIFSLIMETPPSFHNYDNKTKIYPQLGASLRRHPDAAQLLLQAYDHDKHNLYKRDFVRHVFQFAGADLLEILHTALESDDRIVRSNAARGCGTIGDASSIPHLIKAMELESGLSRASIVWALGELKAKEARPMLETLYVAVRNDEERIRHAGFMQSQRIAVMQSHYDTMQNIEAIGSEWDELKDAVRLPPTDPIKNEDLLSTEYILDALRKIDPAASQAFYRTLAGEKNREARREAARQLAYGTGNDRDRNLPILRNLRAEDDWQIQMNADVSLLMLGEKSAEPRIIEWLRGSWQKRRMIEQLQRVGNPETLAFAQVEIRTLIENETISVNVFQLKAIEKKLFPPSPTTPQPENK